MSQPFSDDFKKNLWAALYEYLITILPVAIYVGLEASHKHDWTFLFLSPEWSIATIFLSFISLANYASAILKSGVKVYGPILGLMGIFQLLIIIIATLNANSALEIQEASTYIINSHETKACAAGLHDIPKDCLSGANILRVILFITSSIVFFIFTTGEKMLKTAVRKKPGG
jgi:hypothetical protein